jgi:hypothetical protein
MENILEYDHDQKNKLSKIMDDVGTVVNFRTIDYNEDWNDVANYVIDMVDELNIEYPGIITSGDDFGQLQVLVSLIGDDDKPNV